MKEDTAKTVRGCTARFAARLDSSWRTVSLLLAVGWSGAVLAEPPQRAWDFTGLWESADKNSVVSAHRCGLADQSLCLRIAWIPDPGWDTENRQRQLRIRPLCQLEIARYERFDDDKWQQGSVYDPVGGRNYDSSLRLRDGRLMLRAFIKTELFGETEVFSRIAAIPAPCGQPTPKADKP